MSILTPTFDYKPRDQFLEFHNRKQRWASLVVHRRGGKTFACVADLCLKAIRTRKKNARYAYIAPFRTQAKEIAWTYLKMLTEGMRDGPPREAELRVKLFNGSWITLYGADNPDSLRGLYFDGAVLDEYGDMKPSLMGEVILPCLLDRKGWLVVIGTPKGRNQFFDLKKKAEKDAGWYFMELQASKSGIIADEDLQQIQSQMSAEEYEQEMECSFDAALKGSYYTALMNELEEKGQISDLPLYNPEQKVSVAADIGYSDSSAWWFWQTRPDGFAIIDYYTAQGEKLRHYLTMLAERGYEYDEIWMPHDARAKSLQTGRSTIEQMMNPHATCPELYQDGDKLPLRIVPRMAVQHGIEAVRMILPNCWFDRANTIDGREALRSYHRKWNENTQSFDDKPNHNWASHGSDAFRMLASVAKGSRGQSAESLAKPRRRPQKLSKGMLQYKDGRIMTVETLDEMAPLQERSLRISRTRRI